jgi:hypothetical protein
MMDGPETLVPPTVTAGAVSMPPVNKLRSFVPGDVVEIAFDDFIAGLTFRDGNRLKLEVTGGPSDGFTDEPEYELFAIGDRVLLLAWRERIGSVVVHAIDRAEQVSHAFVASADGRFLRMTGKVRIMAEAPL